MAKRITTISASVTRPANTTAYDANDALADSTSAPSAIATGKIRLSGAAWLVNARAVSTAYQSTLPQLRVFLLPYAPAMTNDGSAFTLTDAEMQAAFGYVDFLNWVAGDDTSGATGNAMSDASAFNPKAIITLAAGRLVYLKPKVLNAYTPVSGEVFTFLFDLEPVE
jgi:hypothetical protein